MDYTMLSTASMADEVFCDRFRSHFDFDSDYGMPSGCGEPTNIFMKPTAAPSDVSIARHQIDAATQGQSQVVLDLYKAIAAGDVQSLVQVMSGPMRSLFDPDKTDTALHFVSCGGVEVLLEIFRSDFIRIAGSRSGARTITTLAEVLAASVRALTELILVQGRLAWLIVGGGDRGAAFEAIIHIGCRVPQMREDMLALMEHTLAHVGPIVLLRGFPSFIKLLSSPKQLDVAIACRVLALLINNNEGTTAPFDVFPQSLGRLRLLEAVVDDNMGQALQIPGFMDKLLSLAEIRQNSMRISDGNRSISVVMQPHADGDEASPTANAPSLPMSWPPPGLQNSTGATGTTLNQAAWVAAALQQLGLTVPEQWQLMNLHPELAAASGNGDAGAASDGSDDESGAGGGMGVPFDSDMMSQPPPPDVSWCVPSGTQFTVAWRFLRPGLLRKSMWNSAAFEDVLDSLAKLPANTAYPPETAIVNAQSEVFFVLNSLLSGMRFRTAWRMLEKAGVMSRMLKMFPGVFSSTPSLTLGSAPPQGQSPPAAAAGQPSTSDGALEEQGDGSDDESHDSASVSHQHDPDTLRKIEYLRVVHEYWDAREISEALRIARDPIQGQARRDLAPLIAARLMEGKEDVCVDNLLCFALESYVRCHWFTDRAHAQTQLAHCVPFLCHKVLLINPKSSSTLDARRLESLVTLLAELIKFNATNVLQVEQFFAESPSRLAHFRAAFEHKPYQTNFFVRALVLTAASSLRCTAAVGVSTTALAAERPLAEAEDAAAMDTMESQSIFTERVYFVRLTVLSWFKAFEDSRRMPSSVDAVTSLANAPALVTLRRRTMWFDERATCFPDSLMHDPRLAQSMVAAADCGSSITYVSELVTVPEAARSAALHLMAHVKFEKVETTERLCEVTTALTLFMREYQLGGYERVDAFLGDVVKLSRQSVEKAVAHAGDSHGLVGSCVARNFYGLICVWISHYVCQERYFNTLFFCTQIDCRHWRHMCVHLLDTLPSLFSERRL